VVFENVISKARSKKQEARSKKQEARSKKQEARIRNRRIFGGPEMT